MNLSTRVFVTLGACLVAGGLPVCAAEPATRAGPARDVAADGTVSVVVDPPRESTPDRGVAEPAPATAAAGLLAELLEPLDAPPAASLYERPLPLLEALERSGDRARRLWITQAYWKVAAAFAEVRRASAAVERLELVAPGGSERDRLVLDALEAERRAERAAAQAALAAAQQELVDLVRLPVHEPLPWPVDRPLVAPYQTHFETIFANRIATGRARAIHRLLPARHESIEARAEAVRAAARSLAAAEADHARGQLAIDVVVAAVERLEAHERRFIEDIRTYNGEIAEYVMAVADFSVPDDRFAAMLIGTPTPWRQQPAVVPAGAAADVPIQQPLAAPPPAALPPAPPFPASPPAFVPQPPLQAAPAAQVLP